MSLCVLLAVGGDSDSDGDGDGCGVFVATAAAAPVACVLFKMSSAERRIAVLEFAFRPLFDDNFCAKIPFSGIIFNH